MIYTNQQEALQDFVSREVYTCQSMLVEELLQKEVFSWDEVDNLYLPFAGVTNTLALLCSVCLLVTDKLHEELRQCQNCYEDTIGAQDIYEWWVVSDFLAEKLKKVGEPILENGFGTWWGRTCTGQAIYLDYAISIIYDNIV